MINHHHTWLISKLNQKTDDFYKRNMIQDFANCWISIDSLNDYFLEDEKKININLTFGEFRRVVAVTKVMPPVLSYTGGFHSASTAWFLKNIFI